MLRPNQNPPVIGRPPFPADPVMARAQDAKPVRTMQNLRCSNAGMRHQRVQRGSSQRSVSLDNADDSREGDRGAPIPGVQRAWRDLPGRQDSMASALELASFGISLSRRRRGARVANRIPGHAVVRLQWRGYPSRCSALRRVIIERGDPPLNLQCAGYPNAETALRPNRTCARSGLRGPHASCCEGFIWPIRRPPCPR